MIRDHRIFLCMFLVCGCATSGGDDADSETEGAGSGGASASGGSGADDDGGSSASGTSTGGGSGSSGGATTTSGGATTTTSGSTTSGDTTTGGGTSTSATTTSDSGTGGSEDTGATGEGGSSETGDPEPSNCKRGISYNREDAADAAVFAPEIGWWYDWGSNPDQGAHAGLTGAGMEFVPMIWSGPPERDVDVEALIDDIPDGARFLLGFNEPNFGAQANLTPEEAAAAWPLLEQIADARDLELVAPAVNYCGGDCNRTDPFEWLDDFLDACTGCRIDYIAFHWYACDEPALQYALGRYKEYGLPVWLTEFACLDGDDTSVEVQDAYMREAVAVLEADPQVFRYSWFIGRSYPEVETYALLQAPGELTPLGETYVSLPGACTE